jgi:hypothetical protein
MKGQKVRHISPKELIIPTEFSAFSFVKGNEFIKFLNSAKLLKTWLLIGAIKLENFNP